MTNQESGRTMVEMLGVLAIIGVLSAGAFSAISYGMKAYRAAWAYQLVEDTAQGVSDLYSWQRALPTDEEKQAMATAICDNDIMDGCDSNDGAATVSTPWGQLKVQADTDTQYTITLTNVPEDICNRLKDMKWSDNVDTVNFQTSSFTCGATNNIEFLGH